MREREREIVFVLRSVVLAVAHPWASASSYVSVSRQFSQRPSCRLIALLTLSSAPF